MIRRCRFDSGRGWQLSLRPGAIPSGRGDMIKGNPDCETPVLRLPPVSQALPTAQDYLPNENVTNQVRILPAATLLVLVYNLEMSIRS